MKITYIFSLLIITTFFSCSSDDDGSSTEKTWLIPPDEVQDGGPGKDGIPSVDSPEFIDVEDVTYLSDNDLVIGIFNDGEQKVYSHPILDWHEIVNDSFGDINYALTYCPLTGTAIAWNSKINGEVTTFGVSGKLYNNNLIPYDRLTDSYWSQMNLNCVNGNLIGTEIEVFPTLETTWKTWKKMYPDSKVLSTNTGFVRSYGVYPYGNYKTDNEYLLFPLLPRDNRLPLKERALVVLNNGNNKVYSINSFDTPQAINDNLGSEELLIVGSKSDNFIVAFRKGDLGNFTVDLSQLPIIGTDDNGNVLEINGEITAGPAIGTQLEQPVSYIGYWFSFGAFYPGIDIYE